MRWGLWSALSFFMLSGGLAQRLEGWSVESLESLAGLEICSEVGPSKGQQVGLGTPPGWPFTGAAGDAV